MTREEWQMCGDVDTMLKELHSPGDRRLRLLAVACCRRVWHLMADEESRNAVEVAERRAEGIATKAELGAAAGALLRLGGAEGPSEVAANAARFTANVEEAWAVEAAAWGARAVGAAAAERVSWPLRGTARAVAAKAERQEQADLVRDLFYPWLPALDPAVLKWQDGTVPRLARRTYDEKRFENMPILADALDEVGAPPEMSEHCRNGKAHVRGCFVLDCLLRKTC